MDNAILGWSHMRRKIFHVVGIICILFAFACSPTSSPATSTPGLTTDANPPSNFVTVSDGKFMLNGKPYYFVGTNFWQGINLGVDGPKGDRENLIAELDRLQRIGVTNLRVMAASEGPNTEPYRMVPALMTSPGVYDESVLDGLDFFIAEIRQARHESRNGAQ